MDDNKNTQKRVDVSLPPLRNDDSGYEYLSKLSEAIYNNPEYNYTFLFSKCSTLSHNGLAVIGGLSNYLKSWEQERSKQNFSILGRLLSPSKIGFSLESMNKTLFNKLQELGFWNYVQKSHGVKHSNSYIGYREHELQLNDAQIIGHLTSSWLTNEKLNMSDKLRQSIISSIYEIFVNAYGHGLKANKINQRVVSCGLHDDKTKELSLSVIDFGGGIIERVQTKNPHLNPKEAFAWALKVGNSTRTDSHEDMPRGLGFDVLRKFIHINGGQIRICSDSYMAQIDSRGEYSISDLPGNIKGTLVSVTINCNENHYYQFESERKADNNKAPEYF